MADVAVRPDRLRCRGHRSAPVGCAGRARDQETHSRHQTRSIDAAVVAGARTRSI